MSRDRGRNYSHSHSHCNREPLLALPRVVQGQDLDLSRVQLPNRHRPATTSTMPATAGPIATSTVPAAATTAMSTAMMVSE